MKVEFKYSNNLDLTTHANFDITKPLLNSGAMPKHWVNDIDFFVDICKF